MFNKINLVTVGADLDFIIHNNIALHFRYICLCLNDNRGHELLTTVVAVWY